MSDKISMNRVRAALKKYGRPTAAQAAESERIFTSKFNANLASGKLVNRTGGRRVYSWMGNTRQAVDSMPIPSRYHRPTPYGGSPELGYFNPANMATEQWIDVGKGDLRK